MDAGLSSLITGLVAGLGIGAVVTAIVQHSLKRKEAAYESQRKDLEARYRVIVLLMYAAVDFEANQASFRINRPDLTTKQLVLDELRAEWHNMLLFASSATVKALQAFIAKPTRITLVQAALAMRTDLGRDAVTVGGDV
jgi:hypothetical protein